MSASEIILLIAVVALLLSLLITSVNLKDARKASHKWMLMAMTQAVVIQTYEKELKKYRRDNKEVVSDDTEGAPGGVERPVR